MEVCGSGHASFLAYKVISFFFSFFILVFQSGSVFSLAPQMANVETFPHRLVSQNLFILKKRKKKGKKKESWRNRVWRVGKRGWKRREERGEKRREEKRRERRGFVE